MRKFTITGMSCAACSSRVEKAVSSLENIDSVSVNLLTNSMNVVGTASDEDIIYAVEKAGYGVISPDKKAKNNDKKTNTIKTKLILSIALLIVLMYFSMGHTMLTLPVPSFFKENPIAIGLLQMILSATILIINKKFFINGFFALLKKSPNMDTLVALGSGVSFAYSVGVLFLMTKANHAELHAFVHDLYFESAAMIVTLITIGKMLEDHSKGKTTSALKSLADLSPKTAIILKDEKEIEIPSSQIKKGDIFILKQGASAPADGVIIEGHCSIDESALTGESIPIDKNNGDFISCATINRWGYAKCEATKVGEDTTLSQIIRLVNDANSTKAPIAKIADKVSYFFVPTVIILALITFFIWLFCGQTLGFAVARGISVLVISCPCALGLATPVAIMVSTGVGAKNGILFKNAISLEQVGKTEIIALDKTGTITFGFPAVTEIIPFGNTTESELLKLAYSLETKSEHPLSKAIIKFAEEKNTEKLACDNFEPFPGNGLKGTVENNEIIGGSFNFISEQVILPEEITENYLALANQGKTPLLFAKNKELLGIIAVMDKIKPDSFEAIKELNGLGIKTVMLTGDNEKTANAVKTAIGVDKVFAGIMPSGKAEVIKNLKSEGKTAMIGDGINDAPALTVADIGVAIGAGTDIAIDAADIVLMNSSLKDILASIKLSRATIKNIKQNLFWAFIYNIIGIPLAAGIWIPVFNLKLNPMFGAAAMSLSSFCVVINALRLNRVKLNHIRKEKKTMEKTIKIEGMMCPHCEARVKQVLEAIDGVKNVVANHKENKATLTLSFDVSDDLINKTIEEQGYKIIK